MQELVRFVYKGTMIRFLDPKAYQVMQNGVWETVTHDDIGHLMGEEAFAALNLNTLSSVMVNRGKGAEAIKAHFLATLRTPAYTKLGFLDVSNN